MKKTFDFDQLEQLIELATHEDLVHFVIDYAKDNNSFGKDLQSFLGRKYLSNKHTAGDYAKQMSKAFCQTKNIGTSWRHFDVTDWEGAFYEAMQIIQEGRKLLNLGNADAAAIIAVSFFKEFSSEFDESLFYDNYDDSVDGRFECEQAQNLLLDAFDHPYMSDNVKNKMVEELKAISKTSFPEQLNNYYVFDFDDMLLLVNQKTMTDEDSLQLLDTQIKQHQGKFDQDTYVARKMEFLKKIGQDAEAEKTGLQYLHLMGIRSKMINECIESKEFDKAIGYATDGVTLSMSSDGHGHADRWREKLLKIYELKGDKEKQIEVCRKLFISQRGQLVYYKKLKSLIDKALWKDYLDKLLAEANLSTTNLKWESNLADIYVEENESEKLFQLIVENSARECYTLDKYAEYAGDNHAEELLEIYTKLLKSEASGNVNVKSYHRIATSMSNMQKLKGGKAAAHQLAVFFREQYRRRPSMMAEISEF